MSDTRGKAANGFTLVEIAIVLVIIGLLLGGILKGQELINNAKVRAIADRQSSLKAAWFAFVDRFAALPGDYIQANIYLTGAAAGNGDGILELDEAPLAFQHLASAGLLRCPQCTETATDTQPTAANSLINTYGGVMSIWHDSLYYAYYNESGRLQLNNHRLMIHTGPRIPSNIMGEVDRKIDDGVPQRGDLRYNDFDPVLPAHFMAENDKCMTLADGSPSKGLISDTVDFWRVANAAPPVWQNCGGSVFI